MKPILRFALVWLFVCIHTLGYAQKIVEDPDPRRFSREIQQFVEWDAKNSFPEDAILFVGSSSIRFWKTHEAFPEYPVINRGFGGSHISDVQFYYDRVIGKYAPSLIVFYAGDNDIAAGKSVSQVVEDYREITNHILQDFPEVKFVYVPIKPSSSRWDYWSKMRETNKRIQAYNSSNDRLYYIDLATPLLDSGKSPRDELFRDDLLHLNERGYKVWNQILRPKLQALYAE